MRGGIAVTLNGFASTANFMVQKPNSGNIYLVISGHSGQAAPVGTAVKHNGITMGTVTRTAFYDGSRADAKIVDIADGEVSNSIFAPHLTSSGCGPLKDLPMSEISSAFRDSPPEIPAAVLLFFSKQTSTVHRMATRI